jgi:HlyD family secretion protein
MKIPKTLVILTPVAVLVILVSAVLLIGGGLLGYRLLRSGEQATTYSQEVVVERGTIVATIAPTGEVYAPRQAELSFDVTKITLTELNVTPGQQVKAGEVLARIDTTSLERAVTEAEAQLTIAQSDLEEVQEPYTELDLTQAQVAVAQAEVSLAEAQETLYDLLNPDIATAEAAVRDAAAELESAKNNLIVVQKSDVVSKNVRDREFEHTWYENNYGTFLKAYERGEETKTRLEWEWNALMTAKENLDSARAAAAKALNDAENKVAQAEDALQEAQEDLATLQAGPDSLELDKDKTQVAQAEYTLEKAQADLAEIQAGPDPEDVEVAQAKVVTAQADLEEAQAALEAATMVAPFDGTIIDVGAEVGDLVSSSIVMVTLADLSHLEVEALVDETDISQVEIGQEAEITFDALAGKKFSGKVLSVPLQGTLSQNIVTYEVPVSLEGTEGVTLKPGMTANLKITVGKKENALLVPAMAVQYEEGLATVLVQDNPAASPVATNVEVGLSDGTYTEIVRGLNEGDLVVITFTPAEEESSPGGPGMMGIPGAGQGGGGPPRQP